MDSPAAWRGSAAGCSQGIGLGLTPAFGDGLGEVGKENGEPEPERDLKSEGQVFPLSHEIPGEHQRRDHARDQHDEHDRVPDHVPRVELVERLP